jgi:predicted CxxxxCH...CXXCH cytochrome family protein
VSPTFNATSLACTNHCHGTAATGGSVPQPLWNKVDGSQAACGACHGLPPPAPHPVVTGGLAACSGCHPGTVKADGTIDIAGGLHVDGTVQSAGHGDFSSPATHGPAFFDYLRGSGMDCRSCHGQDLGGAGAPSCNGCHLSSGWTASWQTNCSFCHGTRNAFTMRNAYTVTAQPTLSAPPDALAQRLTGVADPSRTGAHQAHLTGRGSTSGEIYAAPVPCGSCHTVPVDYAHAGGPGRAPVVLQGTGGLPASLGTYSQSAGTCTTYCHGSTLANASGQVSPPPVWTGAELGCAGCHGNPPISGMHDLHVIQYGYYCADCHYGSVDYVGAVKPGHLNGSRDVQFNPPTTTWTGTFCSSNCHEGSEFRPWRF